MNKMLKEINANIKANASVGYTVKSIERLSPKKSIVRFSHPREDSTWEKQVHFGLVGGTVFSMDKMVLCS
tara:strand:- start:448 stop:657 length:210 start_codon:yes stop_codon:yes gene_type:complete